MRRRPPPFVYDHAPTLLLLHTLGKTYGRPPSQWLGLQPSDLADQMLALDFDAAAWAIGADAETQLREAHAAQR